MQANRKPSADAGIMTERLRLEPLVIADAFEFAVIGGPIEVASMTGQVPFPLSVATAQDWIAELPSDTRYRCIMAIRHGRDLVGICGYAPEDEGLSSIGYLVGKAYWGRGFATEAARALIERCFAMTASSGITAAHFAENTASARVLEKLGFAMSGRERIFCQIRQEQRDIVVYILTASAFRQQGRSR